MRRRFAVSLEVPIAAGMRRAYLAGIGISCVRALMLLMQACRQRQRWTSVPAHSTHAQRHPRFMTYVQLRHPGRWLSPWANKPHGASLGKRACDLQR
jgi:hypothetical protein